MIGHYLLTLTPEQEARVLTTKMRPVASGIGLSDNAATCLVMASHDLTDWRQCHDALPSFRQPNGCHVATLGDQYDQLCYRFGTDRVNAAIRTRVLANMARRTLSTREATV